MPCAPFPFRHSAPNTGMLHSSNIYPKLSAVRVGCNYSRHFVCWAIATFQNIFNTVTPCPNAPASYAGMGFVCSNVLDDRYSPYKTPDSGFHLFAFPHIPFAFRRELSMHIQAPFAFNTIAVRKRSFARLSFHSHAIQRRIPVKYYSYEHPEMHSQLPPNFFIRTAIRRRRFGLRFRYF